MVPIALMVFNRPDLTQRVIDQLALCKPHTLYVIADGPRSAEESPACAKTLEIALNPPWECDVMPFIRKKNVGMVRQFKEGLDFVFNNHDRLIFLEDDHLISPSALPFAEELLNKYNDNEKISHINFSNLNPTKTTDLKYSYFFSTYFSVWGFATWKRVWKSYKISMPEWSECNQKIILQRYGHNKKERLGMKKMFDLHCNNDDPWTYDYQWEFNCMHKDSYAITPKFNLCTNIGFERDDAMHNKCKNPFLNQIQNIPKNIIHPNTIEKNVKFDKSLSSIKCPSKFSILLNKVLKKLSLK